MPIVEGPEWKILFQSFDSAQINITETVALNPRADILPRQGRLR